MKLEILKLQNSNIFFSYIRQIVEVANCGISKIGDLSFDLEDGACTVANNEIYLCFSSNDLSATKTCRKLTDPLGSATAITDTTYVHSKADIAASSSKFEFLTPGHR